MPLPNSPDSNTQKAITIRYNDQTVHLDADNPLNIKLVNNGGANGHNLTAFEKNKIKNQTELTKPQFKVINNGLLTSGLPKKASKMTTSYIQYVGREEESSRGEVEYDLDREDLEWLRLYNTKRQRQGLVPIEEGLLERAIDALEKESHFQFLQNGHMNSLLPFIDNDAPCCICNDSEDSDGNKIIFCDMCNIAVHQECYGVPYIPEGQWLCRRCQLSPSVSVCCELCPFTTGAFKQTSDGRWAHVICAIWLPEVHFANTVFLEPVEGVGRSLYNRGRLRCKICKIKVGACLQCSSRSCLYPFHATCGFHAGLKMEVKEIRRKNRENLEISRFTHCPQHSQQPLIRSSSENNNSHRADWKREMGRKIREAKKKLDDENREVNSSVPVPVIPREKIEQIGRSLQVDRIADISTYWSMKRKSRLGVPLIRRLQVYFGQQKPIMGRSSLDGIASNQAAGSSRTASRLAGQDDPAVKTILLRRNFERARLISEMVKKRENIKLDLLQTNAELLAKMKPIPIILEETLNKLVEKDHEKVFAAPVDEADVPGYYSIIREPMDLQRMRGNLKEGKYKRMADLRADFRLMIRNCATFNKDNPYFYNYGQRIKQIGLNVIRSGEEAEASINQILPVMSQVIEPLTMSVKLLKQLKRELTSSSSQPFPTTTTAAARSSSKTAQPKPRKRKSTLKVDGNGKRQKREEASSSSVVLGPKCEVGEEQQQEMCQRPSTPVMSEAYNNEHNSNEDSSRYHLLRTPPTPPTRPSTNRKRKLTPSRIGQQQQQRRQSISIEAIIPPHYSMASIALNEEEEGGADDIVKKGSRKGKKELAISEKKTTSTPINMSNSSRKALFPHASCAMEDVTKPSTTTAVRPEKALCRAGSGTVPTPKQEQQKQQQQQQKLSFAANLQSAKKKQQSTKCQQYGRRPPSNGRGVDKRTYANSYLTEASSTAEESDYSPYLDAGAFSSSLEEEADEDEELPAIGPQSATTVKAERKREPKQQQQSAKKRMTTTTNVKNGGRNGAAQRVVESSQHVVEFHHNDIVMAQLDDGLRMLGRVIDLLMRYDFEGQAGLGKDFFKQALVSKPRHEPKVTLVILFDQPNTTIWLSNDRLQHVDMSPPMIGGNNSQQQQSSTLFGDAFKKALQFCRNVIGQ